jgi:hypothetical protein
LSNALDIAQYKAATEKHGASDALLSFIGVESLDGDTPEERHASLMSVLDESEEEQAAFDTIEQSIDAEPVDEVADEDEDIRELVGLSIQLQRLEDAEDDLFDYGVTKASLLAGTSLEHGAMEALDEQMERLGVARESILSTIREKAAGFGTVLQKMMNVIKEKISKLLDSIKEKAKALGQKIKENPVKSLLIAAGALAVIGGGIAYYTQVGKLAVAADKDMVKNDEEAIEQLRKMRDEYWKQDSENAASVWRQKSAMDSEIWNAEHRAAASKKRFSARENRLREKIYAEEESNIRKFDLARDALANDKSRRFAVEKAYTDLERKLNGDFGTRLNARYLAYAEKKGTPRHRVSYDPSASLLYRLRSRHPGSPLSNFTDSAHEKAKEAYRTAFDNMKTGGDQKKLLQSILNKHARKNAELQKALDERVNSVRAETLRKAKELQKTVPFAIVANDDGTLRFVLDSHMDLDERARLFPEGLRRENEARAADAKIRDYEFARDRKSRSQGDLDSAVGKIRSMLTYVIDSFGKAIAFVRESRLGKAIVPFFRTIYSYIGSGLSHVASAIKRAFEGLRPATA